MKLQIEITGLRSSPGETTRKRIIESLSRILNLPRIWWKDGVEGDFYIRDNYIRTGIKIKDLEFIRGYIGRNGHSYSIYSGSKTPYGHPCRLIKPERFYKYLKEDINWIQLKWKR